MFGINLSSQEAFVAGIAALWLFSAAVGALESPTETSSAFYKWFFRFLKAIAGDLGAVFGKYIPTKAAALLIAVVLLFAAAFAQPVSAQTLSTQATASAFHYQGNWFAGTEQTQSFPLVYFGAQKGQIFSLGAREMIAPGTFNGYMALGNYQPDISALIRKTTFNPDQFSLSVDVAGGLATLANNTTKPAIEGRVNFAYALSPNVALTGAYAGGGFIGKDRFAVVSAGFSYLFGAQNMPSVAMKRMLKRQAAKKMALQVAGGF